MITVEQLAEKYKEYLSADEIEISDSEAKKFAEQIVNKDIMITLSF